MSIADSAEIGIGRTISRIAARCVLRTASDIFVLSAGKMDTSKNPVVTGGRGLVRLG